MNKRKQKKMRRKENQFLCQEFPWLAPRNCWSGEPEDDYKHDYTMLDNMPVGWKRAFGWTLCKELREALGDLNYDYMIVQVKEKYGSLRWYDNGNTPDGYKVIEKCQ